jgi:hypothetical protein
MPTRKLDPRKRGTRFIEQVRRNFQASGLGFPSVVNAISKPRTFVSYDTNDSNEVLVTANVSNTPENRDKAARILGGPVRVVFTNSVGTIWKAVK